VPPDGAALAAGLAPDLSRLAQPGALALAVGIVGATVMPHNLYLHSSIVQGSTLPVGEAGKRWAIRDANKGSVMALLLAMMVNGAILALGAGAFHMTGHAQVGDRGCLSAAVTDYRHGGGGAVLRNSPVGLGSEQHFHGHAGRAGRAGRVSCHADAALAEAVDHAADRAGPGNDGVLLLGNMQWAACWSSARWCLCNCPLQSGLIRANRDPAIMKGLRASGFMLPSHG
jgi:hypothetical protein